MYRAPALLEDILLRYLIGIDGGGTKTAICAACACDFLLSYTETSGTSWREHGPSGVAGKLKKSVDELIGEGQIAGIAIWLPCHGESIEGDQAVEQAIRKEFPGVPIYFSNDVEVGWAGSLALEPGINIVAGTGSIAFGKDIHGKTARGGGWSEFFSDEGSCYWMGRKVLELFSKQADGRIPKDALYEVVYRKFGLSDDFEIVDIVHERYIPSREKVASLQLLAKEAALLGSQCSISLYIEAAGELCLIITAIKNQLDFDSKPFNVSYTGGLFKADKLILPHFSRKIEEIGGKLITPRLKPEEGALLLAYQHFYPDGLEGAKKAICIP